MPISTRRPSWRSGRDQEFRPALHRGEAHPGGREASPTSSPSWCSRRRRSSKSAIRWIPRPMSAPSSTRARRKLFERRVDDAVAKGAKLLHGNDRKGALYPPTVVDHVPYDCELVHEETFGPVIPIIRVPERHRRGHPDLELDGLRPVVGRLHQPARLHHALHQRARGRHGQCLGGAGLSHRDVAVRRDQGFRPRLQGRRGEAMKSFTNVKT